MFQEYQKRQAIEALRQLSIICSAVWGGRQAESFVDRLRSEAGIED